ncbi:MAG: hypothetical protein MUO94_01360 [Thermoplasmata archaeon]|nr:hypothetical protein [Thermoplasmata archaeon]
MQIFVVVWFLVLIAFVAIHQTTPTGFFTDEFGTLGAVLLYGMLILGMPPAMARFLTGRKNVGRLLEAGGLVVCVVAALFLFVTFPFDFSHFADPVPGPLEFLLAWVSGTFARVLLGLTVLMCIAASVHGAVMYFAVRRRLRDADEVGQGTEDEEGPSEQ